MSFEKKIKKIMEFSIIGLIPPPPTYFQPKNKCVLNDSEWLETHFKEVL